MGVRAAANVYPDSIPFGLTPLASRGSSFYGISMNCGGREPCHPQEWSLEQAKVCFRSVRAKTNCGVDPAYARMHREIA
jgi:hypothetical protein